MAGHANGGETIEHPLVKPGTIERRSYQTVLAASARGEHTLVCLPTGLGKTAVSLLVTAGRLDDLGGKALLLAPTKPLVAQHADDYRAWLDIPDEEIVIFTGEVKPNDRATQWKDATIIIATPQVIENDLIGNRISLTDVVHLTFDECHRATGDYAYTYIAERYHADAQSPLVTGLSASPGDDKEAILDVCDNLGIKSVEVKTESDADVAQFAHRTDVEWKHIDLPDEVIEIRDALNSVISDRLATLKELGVSHTTDPSLSESDLQQIRAKLQKLIDSGNSAGYKGMSLHAEVRKLKTAVSYVETQSVESVRRYFERQKNAARSSGASKASQRFVSEPKVKEAMRQAEEYDELHPKFRQARMLIAETLGINDGNRVIVFTESRDTAETLTEFLGEHFPTERFVGQGDRDGSDGMTQREQQDTLEAFRSGDFDVLVSTSVAEEGLDVPEVDLVLFYEPVPTAIRSIQRKGRTGRQTEGRVVVLMAEDTRDEAYFWISKRREEEMHEELRTLKDAEAEIESRLVSSQDELNEFETGDDSSASDDEPGSNVRSNDGANSAEIVEPLSTDGEGANQQGLSDFADSDPRETTPSSPAPKEEDSSIEIVADQRELDTVIARDLSKRPTIEVRLETLDVGDYVLSDRVVVERKSVADFLDTLVSGDRSLFDQISAMKRHYSRPVVIVEGDDLYSGRDVHPNAIRGAIASLAVDFGASVLRTVDAADTTELLDVIAKREQSEDDRETSVHGEKTQKTLAEQQEYVVASIAEVGPVTARTLLAAFGSVEAVMTAETEELISVEGIGEVTATRIREVVGSEYARS